MKKPKMRMEVAAALAVWPAEPAVTGELRGQGGGQLVGGYRVGRPISIPVPSSVIVAKAAP